MSNQVNASELLQQVLDERFEAGRAAGRLEGFEEGRTKALNEVGETVKTMLTPGAHIALVHGPFFADHPGDENDAAPPRAVDCQPPYIRRALEYVEQHPRGVTRQQAETALRNRNVLYTLARLGLVEKRGPQFFPKNAEAQR